MKKTCMTNSKHFSNFLFLIYFNKTKNTFDNLIYFKGSWSSLPTEIFGKLWQKSVIFILKTIFSVYKTCCEVNILHRLLYTLKVL